MHVWKFGGSALSALLISLPMIWYSYCMSIVFHFLRSLDLVTARVVNTVLHSLTLSCSTTEVRTTCLLCHLATSARGPLWGSSSLHGGDRWKKQQQWRDVYVFATERGSTFCSCWHCIAAIMFLLNVVKGTTFNYWQSLPIQHMCPFHLTRRCIEHVAPFLQWPMVSLVNLLSNFSCLIPFICSFQ